MGEEQKFEIGNKAKELLFSVLDITTSRQHYPVKYKKLVTYIQEYALGIHSDVSDANSMKTDTTKRKQDRYDLQTSAISKCNKFLALIEYSLHAHLISTATSEAWTDLTRDIKYMTLAWRKNI